MPSLSGLHMCAHDLDRTFVALVQLDQLFVGQALLGEVLQRFQTQFQCLLCDHGNPRIMRTGGRGMDSFAGRDLTNLLGQLRQELQDVVHNADVGDLEDRSFGVLVDGDDERIALDAGQVLERPADAARQVDLGLHGLHPTSQPGATFAATWHRPPDASNSPPRQVHRPVPARWRCCPAPECRGRRRPVLVCFVMSTSPCCAGVVLR